LHFGKGRQIRVNAVAPGPIWTPLIPSTFDEERTAKHGASVTMERAGQPNEVAPCYLFLPAVRQSSYITGQVLHPNGGTVPVLRVAKPAPCDGGQYRSVPASQRHIDSALSRRSRAGCDADASTLLACLPLAGVGAGLAAQPAGFGCAVMFLGEMPRYAGRGTRALGGHADELGFGQVGVFGVGVFVGGLVGHGLVLWLKQPAGRAGTDSTPGAALGFAGHVLNRNLKRIRHSHRNK